MPSPAELVAAYGREYDLIRRELTRLLGSVWREVAGPAEANLDAWLRIALPAVAGAGRNVVTLVTAYLDSLSSEWGITDSPKIDPADIIGKNLRGVDPAEVYKRPIVDVRRALADGHSLARSNQIASQRAVVLGDLDLSLTHRATAQQSFEQLGFQRYLRVPTGASCDLCKTAARNRYKTADLLPIHARCDCRVMPEPDGRFVGRRPPIPEPSTTVEPAVREHGELGPVLVDRRNTFTGPGDLGG